MRVRARLLRRQLLGCAPLHALGRGCRRVDVVRAGHDGAGSLHGRKGRLPALPHRVAHGHQLRGRVRARLYRAAIALKRERARLWSERGAGIRRAGFGNHRGSAHASAVHDRERVHRPLGTPTPATEDGASRTEGSCLVAHHQAGHLPLLDVLPEPRSQRLRHLVAAREPRPRERICCLADAPRCTPMARSGAQECARACVGAAGSLTPLRGRWRRRERAAH